MFFGRKRTPNLLDLFLCFAQSGTNMALVKRMPRGQWMMTRPSYQAGAIMRPVLTLSAMIYDRPDLHTSSLQIIHAFIYTRCLIYIWSKARLLDKYSDIYMVAVFSAAILAMADTPCPAILSKAYVLCVAGISLTNHWTAKQIAKSSMPQSVPKVHLLKLLLRLGLVDLPILKGEKLPEMIDDDYCDNPVANETKTRNPSEAQEVVDRVSATLSSDNTEARTQTMTGIPTTEESSADATYLTLWMNTEDLIPEVDNPSTHSQIVTTTYSPKIMGTQVSSNTVLDFGDIVADPVEVLPSLDESARTNHKPRTKRWRSALSLRGLSASAALRDAEIVSKTLKLGPRVLVDEIEIPEDDFTRHEVTFHCKQSRSKRVLMHRILEKFKKREGVDSTAR